MTRVYLSHPNLSGFVYFEYLLRMFQRCLRDLLVGWRDFRPNIGGVLSSNGSDEGKDEVENDDGSAEDGNREGDSSTSRISLISFKISS